MFKAYEFWNAITTGERVLVVIQLVLYVWTIVEFIRLQVVSAVALMAVNGILVLILTWSLYRPRGTGL